MRRSAPMVLLPLLLLHFLLARRAAACGRRPARIQLPPAQYLRPFVIRKVSCERHEQIFCANGGRCTVPVKWSVVQGRIEERLDRPSCECASGYTGYNCDILVLHPSIMDLNTAAFVSIGLFVALLLLLLIVIAYLCYVARRPSKRPKQLVGDCLDDDVVDGVPLATVAIATTAITHSIYSNASTAMAFDRASVRDFIDENEEGDERSWLRDQQDDGDDWDRR